MRAKWIPGFFALAFILAIASDYGYARTIVLEGSLDSNIAMKQRMGFSVKKPLSKLSFIFALPAAFKNRAVSQEIKELTVGFDPEPDEIKDETDAYGNRFKNATWNRLNKDARVSISFSTHITAGLSAMESNTPFPIEPVPQGERLYLKATELVQKNDPEILSLSRELTGNSPTEYAAVTSIINYVADSIKYTYNPARYDAVYTLKTSSGNCQNFAHLCMALLRAAGIPARIVGG
ncbi:MAG: transglutaminase domain-containing protein [Pseudomonadota bacterium]